MECEGISFPFFYIIRGKKKNVTSNIAAETDAEYFVTTNSFLYDLQNLNSLHLSVQKMCYTHKCQHPYPLKTYCRSPVL